MPTSADHLAFPTLLQHPQPECGNARLALVAVRRMGARGLGDAAVLHNFLRHFGAGYHRPLTLMRAFVADLSAVATGAIAIAPCCCPRMTAAEAAMLRSLVDVGDRPELARLLLADLLGARRVEGVMASAAAVAQAFADAGRPISG